MRGVLRGCQWGARSAPPPTSVRTGVNQRSAAAGTSGAGQEEARIFCPHCQWQTLWTWGSASNSRRHVSPTNPYLALFPLRLREDGITADSEAGNRPTGWQPAFLPGQLTAFVGTAPRILGPVVKC